MPTLVHPASDAVSTLLSYSTLLYAATSHADAATQAHAASGVPAAAANRTGWRPTDLVIGSTSGVDEAQLAELDDARDAHYARVDSYRSLGRFDGQAMQASHAHAHAHYT